MGVLNPFLLNYELVYSDVIDMCIPWNNLILESEKKMLRLTYKDDLINLRELYRAMH